MQEMVQIELTPKEAETFKKFRRFQEDWEKLFSSQFIGSLTIHRDEKGKEIVFEWREKKKHFI